MFLILIVGLVGLSAAQVVVHNPRTQQWPENTNTLGGAIVGLYYPGLGNGSCTVQLPQMVNLFHVMNGFIIPDGSSAVQGLYKVSAPTHWSLINGTFNVLVIFQSQGAFNITDIELSCDPTDVSDINVYSFPQNNEEEEASSTICFRPAFHQGDVLTITFPVAIKRFNVTTGDSNLEVSNEDNMVYTITGFKHPFDNNYNTEISFNIQYNDVDGVNNWFSAADITVVVDRAPTPEAPAS